MLDPFAKLFQHCWGHARLLRMVYKDLWVVSFSRCTAGPNIVGSCCIRLHTTANTSQELPTLLAQQCWELLRFDRFQTLLNNTQQHPTTSNGVCKRTQHVRSNNVESCWPTMLRPFARGLRVTFLGKGFQLRTRRKHLMSF